MTFREFAPLLISAFALSISLYNLYSQQFRRRDKIIGHRVESSLYKGEFDRYVEYSIANIGDTQLLIKEIQLCVASGLQAVETSIIHSSCATVPVVLKPGDISIFRIFYNSQDLEKSIPDEDVDIHFVEFGIYSPNGIEYRLPHVFHGKEVTHKSLWGPFKLSKKHSML